MAAALWAWGPPQLQHSENENHGIWSHHFMSNRRGNSGNCVRFYFEGAPKSLQMVTAAVKLKVHVWTVKKTEHRRTDAFELWCWRRLSRVPWTARRSNQSILKEISHGISLEGMMLKLKLQSFGHLMRRVDSLEKTLMLGGIGGRRRR